MGYYSESQGDGFYDPAMGDPSFWSWLGNAAKQVLKVASPVLSIAGNFIPGLGAVSGIIGTANNMLNGEAQPPATQMAIGGGEYQSMSPAVPSAFPNPAGVTYTSEGEAIQEVSEGSYDPSEYEEVG